MKPQPEPLAQGLYLVATPLGNARDITLRALDILSSADVLAAEDTRTLRQLLSIHGIALGGRPLLAYHDHSAPKDRARLLGLVRDGRSVAYASEAGTPLIADPGYALVREARAEGLPVTAAPGPSAAILALTLAGLPTDRFLFCGFPPTKAGERRRWLERAMAVEATLVLYESPRRVREIFADLVEIAGEDRPAALCRELTKKFEDVRRGTLGSILAGLDQEAARGECVVVLQGGPAGTEGDVTAELEKALHTMSVRDAADAVAGALGRPRRKVYQEALRIAAERGKAE